MKNRGSPIPGLGCAGTDVRTHVRTYVGGLSSCAYRQTPQTSENEDLSKRADGSVEQGLTEDRLLPRWNPDPAKTATEPAAEESEAQ